MPTTETPPTGGSEKKKTEHWADRFRKWLWKDDPLTDYEAVLLRLRKLEWRTDEQSKIIIRHEDEIDILKYHVESLENESRAIG